VPASAVIPRPDAVADAVRKPWRQLGLDPAAAASVVVTPACGLAGLSPRTARQVLATAKAAAGELAEWVQS
jgi:methionine synthase II (cobalamin-independent)